MNIYRENGYNSRTEYLQALAEEFKVDLDTVREISFLLGANKDFDGLPISLKHYVAIYGEEV